MKKLTFVLICLMLSVGLAFAQTTKVAGVVTSSEDGYPVIGASVVAKGTTQGTVTDIDGNFTIDVPSSVKTLIFSYVGMNTKEVPVKSVMNVVLDPASLDLEEVVVTGYGITKKAAFTGSAQTLKSEELVAKTDANFMKSLQGSVAGLQMNNRGGQPGAYASVNIRGIGSVNSGTEPLYVIDGMPYFSDKVGMNSGVGSGQQASSPLASINPADIESINVLKDATATSIYGARAANGVIVITTKKGKEGKPQVNLTAKAGVSKVFNLDHNYRAVNLDRYLDIWGGALSNSNQASFPSKQDGINYLKEGFGITDKTKSVDWLEEVLRTGFTQEYNVDVQGGKDGLKYFVSAGYFDNEGVLIGTGMDRYSGRLNLEQSGKVVSFGVQASGSISNINNAPSESQYVNPIVAVYDLRPWEQVYNEDGSYNLDAYYNPVAINDPDKGDIRKQKQTVAIINPWATVKFAKDFTFKTSLGLNWFNLNEFNLWSMMNPQGAEMNRQGIQNKEDFFTWTFTNTLNWVKTAGSNNFNVLLGQEAQRQTRNRSYLAANNYPANAGPEIGNASTPVSAGTYKYESSLASYFTNLQYDYAGKYYLSGSVRVDGTSRVGDNNRWGTFYSVGGKYRISGEEFMEPTSEWLTNLAVRTSYGTVGNQDIGWYEARQLYGFGYDYKGNPGAVPTQIGNPDLKWEKSAKFNVGLDMMFFNRVSLDVEFYDSRTKDMIFYVPLSLTGGIATMPMNVGEMKNTGIEALINATLIQTKDWNWTMKLNLSHNKNEIVKLSTEKPIENITTIRKAGEAYNTFYMKEYAGVDPTNGKAMWYKGTEGKETTYIYNEAGQRIVGKADPKLFGGVGTSVSYKGFDLNLDFSYKIGGKVYNSGFNYDMQVGHYKYGPVSNYVYENAWTPENPYTDVPAFVFGDRSQANEHSSRFLMDGSYLRLKTIMLGYTLPRAIASKAKMSNVRFYVSADNLFTVAASDYIGFDPETDATGIQSWSYPVPTNVMFGVNIGF